MTSELSERRKLHVTQFAVGLGGHRLLSFTVTHQIGSPVVVDDNFMFLGQMFMECMQRAENIIASLDALPPLAVCLQLMLEPFMSRFVGAIGYLTIVECANLN
jgi:hypothetical protein